MEPMFYQAEGHVDPAAVQGLVEAGMRPSEVAAALSCTKSAVDRAMEEVPLPDKRKRRLPGGPPNKVKLDMDLMVELYKRGCGTNALGDAFGIAQSTVRMRLKAEGVEMRQQGYNSRVNVKSVEEVLAEIRDGEG